jgi:hypothetical protein
MPPFLKTPEAACALGVTYHRLIGLVRFRKIIPLPEKDSSGDYLWSQADLGRARQALRPLREQQEAAHAIS